MNILSENFKAFRNQFNLTQDQLSQNISVDLTSIAFYESGRIKPSIKVLLKTIGIYGISLDYLVLRNQCMYPRNIRLLNLAKHLDKEAFSEARSSIEGIIKNLLKNIKTIESSSIQDFSNIELTDSFQKNLKDMRNHKNLTQSAFAKCLDINRSSYSQYEISTFPSIEKIIKISEALEVSIHALTTGKKLFFDFEDRLFGKTILQADKFLSLDHQKFLIEFMENINQK